MCGATACHTVHPVCHRPDDNTQHDADQVGRGCTVDALHPHNHHPQASPHTALYESTLEDLRLLEVIGSGSSGTVRKAMHRATGTMLVLKVGGDTDNSACTTDGL